MHLFCTPEDKDPLHPIAGYIFSFQKCCSFFPAAKFLVRPTADKSTESVPEPEAFRLFLLFRTDKCICPLYKSEAPSALLSDSAKQEEDLPAKNAADGCIPELYLLLPPGSAACPDFPGICFDFPAVSFLPFQTLPCPESKAYSDP